MPYRAMFHRVYWALVALFVTAIMIGGGSIYYTNERQKEWCALLTTLDGAYQSTPPQTPTGKEVAKQIHLLTGKVHCK